MNMMAEIGPMPIAKPLSMKVVSSSVIGTAIEWYDFIIYGLASGLVFGKLFFPELSPAVGTIAAIGSYGVGFFARPLGGVLFGHFGDRVGRKAVLSLTIILTGLGTVLIGCLPTYEQAGILAPLGLVLLRLIQGIGLGGERSGAVLMVIESAPAERRGFFGSLVQLGYPLGVIISTAAFALVSTLPQAELLAWGWRVPFLASVLLVIVGLYIRLGLEETIAFSGIKAKSEVIRAPLVQLFRTRQKELLVAIGLIVSEISFSIVVAVFSVSYVTGTLGLPRSTVFTGILIASLVQLFMLPLFGHLSDKYGRKPIFLFGCLFFVAFAFPIFWLFNTRDPILITAAIVLALSFGQASMYAPEATWVAEQFSSGLRYSGASVGIQIGAAMSGGLTPIIAASLYAWSGATWPISVYLILLALVSLTAALAARETAGRSLD